MTQTTLDAQILVSMTYVSRANMDMSAKEFSEILQQVQEKMPLTPLLVC